MMATQWGQRRKNASARPPQTERYLALDSREFRLFLFFSLMALIAIGALVMAFVFEVADLFGVLVAFVILMMATTAGTYLPASIRRFIVTESDEEEEEGVTHLLSSGDASTDALYSSGVGGGDEMTQSASSGDASLTLLSSVSAAQHLSEKELATRREFFEFLYQVITFGEVGENTWAEKGMTRADYRICMDYLAKVRVVQKQNGAKPAVLTSFHEALRRIAVDKRDENFWADALNYHTLINSTYSTRLRQQTSSPTTTTSAADSSADDGSDDSTDTDNDEEMDG